MRGLTVLPIAALAAVLFAPPASADDPAPFLIVQKPAADEGPQPVEVERDRRSEARRKAQIRRLENVMQREGPSFSQARYDKYNKIRSGGAILITVGALSMVTGFALIVASAVAAPESYYGDDPELVEQGYYNDYEYKQHEKSVHLLAGGLAALITGGLMVGAGIGITVAGRSGMKRQNLLKRKDEILAADAGWRLTLRLVADPRQELLGVRLSVAL
jgi:hypothetical protein